MANYFVAVDEVKTEELVSIELTDNSYIEATPLK